MRISVKRARTPFVQALDSHQNDLSSSDAETEHMASIIWETVRFSVQEEKTKAKKPVFIRCQLSI